MNFFVFCAIFLFVVFFLVRVLAWRRVLKMFADKSCIVFGARGSGKDLLMSNVVAYRKLPYCSNMNYCEGKAKAPFYYPFEPVYLKLGGNKYTNFAIFSTFPLIAKVTPFKKSHILFACDNSVLVKSTITLVPLKIVFAMPSTCVNTFGVIIEGELDKLINMLIEYDQKLKLEKLAEVN